jgi:hypothetical protein
MGQGANEKRDLKMANVDTAETAKRKKVAEHSWLGASGQVVDGIELATGIQYKDLQSGKVVAYTIPGAAAGSVMTMLAAFGARTLATNTGSANRQAVEKGESSADDADAITGRFADLGDGDWGAERGGGGGGFGMNVEAMGNAIIAWATKNKKDHKTLDEYVKKLTDEKEYRKAVKTAAGGAIMAEYVKLTAKASGSEVKGDDIL